MPSLGEATKNIPFRAIRDAVQWLVGDKVAYLVVTENNWPNYYSSPPSGSNFATLFYVVASIGAKPNPGYSVRIQQLEQMKERVTVKVELKEPDPRKVYPQIIVHPVSVAEVAKVDLAPRGVLEFVFVDQKGQQLASLTTEI